MKRIRSPLLRSTTPLLAGTCLVWACGEGEPLPGNTEAAAAPPPSLRVGEPRLRLGGIGEAGREDFYDVVGVVVDRQAGLLVVANGGDATLRAFDLEDGAWRATWGGVGDGPEELEELTAAFAYRGDSLLIFDAPRDRALVWPYLGGRGRGVTAPTFPEGGPRFPALRGALADGRLVWTATKPYLQLDEPGEAHTDTMVIFLTSPGGDGVDPIAATLGRRSFNYTDSGLESGLAPFSPVVFVLARDSMVLFGSTQWPRAEWMVGRGATLDPIAFSLASRPLRRADREFEIERRRRVLTRRPLPPSLVRGQTAILDLLPFPDSFPALGDVVAGDDGRIWVRGYRRPARDGAQRGETPPPWHVYAGPEDRGWQVEFPTGFELMWADEGEAVGVVRDEFDLEYVVVVPLPPSPAGGDR